MWMKKKISNWLVENELSSFSAKEDADAIETAVKVLNTIETEEFKVNLANMNHAPDLSPGLPAKK